MPPYSYAPLAGSLPGTDTGPFDRLDAIERLRGLTRACLAQQQYETAIWYADKLVALSGKNTDDVLLLATAQLRFGEAGRAYNTLERAGLLDARKHANPSRPSQPLHSGVGPAYVSLSRQPLHPNPLVSRAADGGIVDPGALRPFYTAALALIAEKRWDDALTLLEGAMEGKGYPGLCVPLDPSEDEKVTYPDAATPTTAAEAFELRKAAPVTPLHARDGLFTWQVIKAWARQWQAHARPRVAAQAAHSRTPPADLPVSDGSKGLSLVALMCHLRGEVALALEHRARAAQWYLAALRVDPYAATSLQRLQDNHLLSDDEEARLGAYLRARLGAAMVLPPMREAAWAASRRQPVAVAPVPRPVAAAQLRPGSARGMSAEVGPSSGRGAAAASRTKSGPAAASLASPDPPPRTLLSTRSQSFYQPTQSSLQKLSGGAAPASSPMGGPQTPAAAAAAKPLPRTASALSVRTGAAKAPGARAPLSGATTPSRSRASSIASGGTEGDVAAAMAAAAGSRPASSGSAGSGSATMSIPPLSVLASPNAGGLLGAALGLVPSPPAPSEPERLDLRWLAALYSCRLSRFAMEGAMALGAKFLPLELGAAPLGRASLDVLAYKAEALAAQHDLAAALEITRRVLAADARHRLALLTHVSVLTQLRRSDELFALGHAAVDDAPKGEQRRRGGDQPQGCTRRASAAMPTDRRINIAITDHRLPLPHLISTLLQTPSPGTPSALTTSRAASPWQR